MDKTTKNTEKTTSTLSDKENKLYINRHKILTDKQLLRWQKLNQQILNKLKHGEQPLQHQENPQ